MTPKTEFLKYATFAISQNIFAGGKKNLAGYFRNSPILILCSTLWIHFLQIQTGHLVLPGRPQGIHKAAKRIDRVPAIKGSLLTGWNGYYRNGASCAG